MEGVSGVPVACASSGPLSEPSSIEDLNRNGEEEHRWRQTCNEGNPSRGPEEQHRKDHDRRKLVPAIQDKDHTHQDGRGDDADEDSHRAGDGQHG